jgi:hypothetical protein
MNNFMITFLSFFMTFTIILNINYGLSYSSSSYMEVDNNVIPLLIPPYKHSEYLLNTTVSPIINATYNPGSSG